MFPDITGPRPLLLPATATKIVGMPSPEEEKQSQTIYEQVLHSHNYFPRLTFIFGFDAKRLIGAFVRRSDSQDAWNPEGAAGLSDFFTVGHV